MLRAYDIIEKKRDGKQLTEEEIKFFINEFVKGHIPDYQMSALLMAIYLKGMTDEETLALTIAMTKSGDSFQLNALDGFTVDKHSTGGVGDSVTLILGPIVAAAGIYFPKMSGRGLGHTGGTVDKLEAINGLNMELPYDVFIENLSNIRLAICSQTGNIAPADKKIYALRDVTATVDSIPLIASSIMSKKLAIESDGLVLDVKVGSGAFMKDLESARLLAREMINIGKGYGRKTMAIISNMDQPLGYAIGNNLEIIEAIDTLKGEGPDDLTELCYTLAESILILSGEYKEKEARDKISQVIESGEALDKFKEMVLLQGGSIDYIDNVDLFKKAKYVEDLDLDNSGYIYSIDAEEIGKASLLLGAGRETIDSVIDVSAGVVLNKKVNDKVDKAEPFCRLYTNKKEVLPEVKKIIRNAVVISENRNEDFNKLILDIIY